MSESDKSKMTAKDYEKLGRSLEQVLLSGYTNKRRFFMYTFIRGMVYGLGLFIGGTIVVGIVMSVLVQFQDALIIGDLVKKIVEIVQNSPTY